MSGTFPTGNIRAVNFKSNQTNLLTTTISGRRQAKTQGAQFFSFTIQTPPLTTADHKEIMGFMTSQQGPFDAFQIVLPEISTPAGSITSNTLVVNAPSNLAAGVKSIPVDGGVASASGYLKKGDVIRFIDTTDSANNVKVYMVTADLDLNSSGEGTLSIEPGLIDGVNNNSTVETNGVQFTVFQTGSTQEYQFGVDGKAQLEVDVREAY